MAETRGTDQAHGGNNQSLTVAIALGVSTVATQTRSVGSIPRDAIIRGIRYYGQTAVTATTLTAECFARTLAGAAGLTLQGAATDIDFATAAAARTGVEATLAAPANLRPSENQLIECVLTDSSTTVGPGDLVVEIQYEVRNIR